MDYLQSVVKTASMKGGDEIMLEQVIELLPVLSSEDKQAAKLIIAEMYLPP